MPPRTVRVVSTRRHPDYDKRLQIIAERRAAGVYFHVIAKELGICKQRVQALAQLLPAPPRNHA